MLLSIFLVEFQLLGHKSEIISPSYQQSIRTIHFSWLHYVTVLRLVVCTECNVAKRCALEQMLLLTA